MNKKTYLIILLLTCKICNAQNLVPNGDFEQYSGCPSWYDQMALASPWVKPTQGSPDYFNQCATSWVVGVPSNYLGNQSAHSGVGYSGMVLWFYNYPNAREYIEAPLTTPLISNQCYHFEMYISLADNALFISDVIGAYFSDTAITNMTTADPLPFTPQINVNFGLSPDTVTWRLITGNFTASGGESYLIIGSFNYDSLTNITQLPGGTEDSYYYIDDVSLTPCTGIEEQNKNAEIKVYPNPIKDKLNITVSNKELSEIILYDIASRKILQQKFTNSVSLNTEQLAKGLYLYEVRYKDGLCKKGKVVKD